MQNNREIAELLHAAAARGVQYLRTVAERQVGVSAAVLEQLSHLGGPTPETGENPFDVLDLLDTFGSPATMASSGGRYFGYVVGGALPPTVAASWLCAAWDQNVGLFDASPTGAYLEQVVIEWLIDILGLPTGCGAAFVTGAQMANFTGLAAARHAVLKKAGWDVTEDGLFGAPEIALIVSEESHVTVLKALSLLGLGRQRVIRVPTDSQGRMRSEMVPPVRSPAIICTQLGNVNSGACDSLRDVCAIAQECGAWVHVDGAFGLWASAAPSRKHLVDGVARADSWAVDAHKWLNVPYDSGIAFVRSPEHLRAAMSVTAEYLHMSGKREPARQGPEFSRRARAVEIWVALRFLGRAGVADMIERTCRHAVRFGEQLKAAGYEILNEIVLNQVLVSFGTDEVTRRVIQEVQTEGTCWCGGTVWHGRAAMRISVCSWATTDSDVDRSVESMIRCAARTRRSVEAQNQSRAEI